MNADHDVPDEQEDVCGYSYPTRNHQPRLAPHTGAIRHKGTP